MNEYHKIQTVYERDPETKFKTLLLHHYARPEFAYLSECQWAFTEKVDGTNIRVMYDGSIRFGGKTGRAHIPVTLLDRLSDRFHPQLERFGNAFGDGVCLYGEGYGAKIQKGGGNYLADQDFVLFDVKVGEWWLQREDVEDVAEKFGLDVVPIISEGTIDEMVDLVRKGFDSTWGDFQAEGIVARPLVEVQARNGDRLITKIKHKDFPAV